MFNEHDLVVVSTDGLDFFHPGQGGAVCNNRDFIVFLQMTPRPLTAHSIGGYALAALAARGSLGLFFYFCLGIFLVLVCYIIFGNKNHYHAIYSIIKIVKIVQNSMSKENIEIQHSTSRVRPISASYASYPKLRHDSRSK
jgi:hypothetical protein